MKPLEIVSLVIVVAIGSFFLGGKFSGEESETPIATTATYSTCPDSLNVDLTPVIEMGDSLADSTR